MPASIEDVARLANVSISTVSRVLNHRDLVNDKTRGRVEEAIKELGYRPNVFARGLMLRKSNILGFVLPDVHGEFYSEVIRGANLTARELGYHLLVSSVTADEDGYDVLSTVGNHGLIDGIVVMVSEIDSRIRETLASVQIPLVVLDGDVPGVKHDSVVIDQRRGAAAMMTHLLASRPGKRIVFLGGHETNLDTIDRLAAYRDALTATGAPPADGDVHFLDYRYETAYKFAAKEVRGWVASGATVFAANDEMAAGVIDAAISAGISVPSDLRVVGYDDTRLAQMTRPHLTTVHVPMSEMGAAAVELLCQRLKNADRPETKITLQTELVVRQSCGAVASVITSDRRAAK